MTRKARAASGSGMTLLGGRLCTVPRAIGPHCR
jgi:hypothetical protein